ncbi:dirigent protein 1 [Brachypodium distachyon]|uniref:Dirigent protein n=1 Tax=Brachypodium distachyon TaxID=15368 RepID=A0A2K2DSF8_BRADI|nr:dirigent protein 1 [Brachypodium distachyon]PNT77215.1 hypothetical protein BRADI_1g59390v3 [Brachypodium distachyon]|eukprot:XP_003561512.2 dirigent protein 1 [Brachypodium distachyon]
MPAVMLLLMAMIMQALAAAVDGGAMAGFEHLRMYMHDSYTGPSPSAVVVINGTGPIIPGSGGARFGMTVVMDDPLTDGPSPASSRLQLGRAQGFYVTATKADGPPAVLLSMNLLLTDGSTLAVTGRNAVLSPVRELAVVGGTGKFRMASGYVLLKTASWHGNDAVLQLDVFVRAGAAA